MALPGSLATLIRTTNCFCLVVPLKEVSTF